MNSSTASIAQPIVLIVDDNLDNLRLLSDMLTKNGYITRRAITGTLALQSLEVTSFDLILLDITMPDLDGYEVCLKLKQDPRFANIPVIFISALHDVLDKVKAFKVGGIDYICKPFQVEEVLARVENQIKIINLRKQLEISNQKLTQNNQQLQRINQRYLNNSLIDPITNFNTKISFIGQLRINLKHHLNSNDFFIFLVIQCDRLKLYQSILKSAAENQCLAYISDVIKNLVPNSSVLGRLNETEFAVFIKEVNVENIDQIIQLIGQIQQQLKLPFTIEQQEFFLNPSCGIVIGDQKYQTPEQILCDARHALFSAQTQGDGNYQIFDEKIQLQTSIDSELKLDFIKALTAESFTIDYQPIISLATGVVKGGEASLCWQINQNKITLEKLGILAAETGFISQLNKWLLTEVCRNLSKYKTIFLKENAATDESQFMMRIELSCWQFIQSDLPAQLETIMQEFKVDQECIVLEISEKALIDHPAIAIKNIEKLQNQSIKTSINNLGTYYLSLIQEHNLALDNLQLDLSSLQTIGKNTQYKKIYGAMVTTAHSLGMTTTIKGIKNDHQLDLFKSLECNFGHGSWISQLVAENSH